MLQSRLVVGAMYSVEVRCGGDWSGALRLGVTTVPAHSRPRPPPRSDRERDSISKLSVLSTVTITLTAAAPRYACPDLIAREGYWARPVKESLARPGARLSFCLCPGDLGSLDLRLFVNNQHAGRHLTGLPAPAAAGGCWAVLDVYGSTVGLASIREEAVPVQVSWWPPPGCR